MSGDPIPAPPTVPTPSGADEGGAPFPGSAPGRKVSLRAKGVFTVVAVAIYTLIVIFITDHERQKLLLMVAELEQVHRVEEQLVQVNMSMARTVLAANVAFSADEPVSQLPAMVVEIEATLSLLKPFEEKHSRLLFIAHELSAVVDDLVRLPTRGGLAVTREILNELLGELDDVTQRTRKEKTRLLAAYKETYDKVTFRTLSFGVLGIVALGAMIGTFFTRLTWDIRKLERRALEIVGGYRGEPLEVTRQDEMGNLMSSINEMQRGLRERERHIARVRQEQFHREKMAAVGSLAAQLAHEINNPIAAISGIASSISDVQSVHQCPAHGRSCQPDLILEQTRRIASITRQIADFSCPSPPEPQLLDINQLIRRTCNFASYDKRFRGIVMDSELDPDIPAVRAVADHVTQVLMNLLMNAADAFEGTPLDGRRILVRTYLAPPNVRIEVQDNGKGMDAETLAHVFDEYFTTKEAGRGSGLGLALSQDLIREAEGSLILESQPGTGTVARIALPMPPARSRLSDRRVGP